MNADALLRDHFGFDSFLPGQREAIDALTTTGRALAVFPTGGGKSLCYQLPALAFDGVTLVVSPLIALMKDQIDFLTRRGIPAARLDASVTADEWRDVTDRLRGGSLKLLYVAPERFNNERFVASIQRLKISLFAIDEAHCISEWGHNFRPDYLKLADTARRIDAERILALTATATPEVARDICAAFDIPAEAAIVTGFYRPNLNLATSPVSAAGRDALLIKRLRSRKPGSAIAYVTLQKTAERVAAMLRDAGFDAEAYHAGMETEARTVVQERWTASATGIVVATIAFGMGIDKPDVRYIYHYNLPKSLESYSQEIGRAGRDGQRSTVEMLATPEDVPTLENFAYGDTPTLGALRSLVAELLGSGEELALNLYELSNRHDLRPLVLRTALTYLELQGVLRQGTPFYAGYEVRPLAPLEDVFGRYEGEPAAFVRGIFDSAKRGRTWFALNPDTVAETLGRERRRVVRALEVLEEQGLVELRVSDVRNRFTCLRPDAGTEALAAELAERFLRREAAERERLSQVLQLVTHDGCQTGFLAAHFGEIRNEPCGHCTFCVTGRPQALPELPPLPPLSAGLDTRELDSLRQSQPEALAEPRALARFLCGLSSPALTRARLTRHALFGTLASYPFHDVLAWAAGL
jgi:ATP-dependent DNA helicase RecQ